jgi:Xaa-Pro aminopeptidase
MKYHQIDRDLFIKNRRIYGSNEAKKCCRFNSNDIYPIGADSTMPFEQSRDIFYLSGVDQKKAFYYYSDAPYEHQKKYYFKETNDHSRLGR